MTPICIPFENFKKYGGETFFEIFYFTVFKNLFHTF